MGHFWPSRCCRTITPTCLSKHRDDGSLATSGEGAAKVPLLLHYTLTPNSAPVQGSSQPCQPCPMSRSCQGLKQFTPPARFFVFPFRLNILWFPCFYITWELPKHALSISSSPFWALILSGSYLRGHNSQGMMLNCMPCLPQVSEHACLLLFKQGVWMMGLRLQSNRFLTCLTVSGCSLQCLF